MKELQRRKFSHVRKDGTAKRGFLSETLAKNYNTLYNWKNGADELVAYKCRVCGDWHLGHDKESA